MIDIDKTPPIAWTIAGSDSGAGAGIQADIKTMQGLGVYGCSVITALTAQNTVKLGEVQYTTPAQVVGQLKALASDLPPRAVKLGMLSKENIMRSVSMHLKDGDVPIVCDPIMKSSTGVPLLVPHALRVFQENILPLVTLLTPNLPEAEQLADIPIKSTADIEKAAAALLKFGCKSVLIKGGHGEGDTCRDYWTDGTEAFWLSSPRIETRNHHGTGCVLSSAITSGLALGLDIKDALVLAKAYLNQGLHHGIDIGKGAGPLGHPGWPSHDVDYPVVTPTAEDPNTDLDFEPFGLPHFPLYPIVDSCRRAEELLKQGVQLLQLRLKTNPEADPAKEVAKAVKLGEKYKARVVINDAWELAIQHKAYGVHLGQDDLETADLKAIADAGLVLGISTHSYYEIARAKACNPSYIAIGAVYDTPSKKLDHPPLGPEGLARLRLSCKLPTVAIAGITMENAAQVLNAGADVVAVISDLANADDTGQRLDQWAEFFGIGRK